MKARDSHPATPSVKPRFLVSLTIKEGKGRATFSSLSAYMRAVYGDGEMRSEHDGAYSRAVGLEYDIGASRIDASDDGHQSFLSLDNERLLVLTLDKYALPASDMEAEFPGPIAAVAETPAKDKPAEPDTGDPEELAPDQTP